jgi:hypothetical protein
MPVYDGEGEVERGVTKVGTNQQAFSLLLGLFASSTLLSLLTSTFS